MEEPTKQHSKMFEIRFTRIRSPFATVIAFVLICGVSLLGPTVARAQEADNGFVSIFDGETLNGWDGDPRFWSVEDGAITGQWKQGMGSYEGGFWHGIQSKMMGGESTFLIWQGGAPKNFELKLDYRIMGG